MDVRLSNGDQKWFGRHQTIIAYGDQNFDYLQLSTIQSTSWQPKIFNFL
jgi:hypothetical protein